MQLNSKLQLTAFFMSMLMLNACGGSGGSTAPNPAAPAVTTPLTPLITPVITPQVTTPVTTTPVTTPAVTTPAVTTPVATTPVATTPATTPATQPTPPAPNVTFNIADLAGSWQSSCQASTSLNNYDEQETLIFKGYKLTTNNIFYVKNTQCKHSNEVLRARINANIELGETLNQGTSTAHTKINIINTKVMLVPMNNTLTTLLNNAGHTSSQSIYNGYGQSSWRKDYWINLSSIQAAKNSFKIDDGLLEIFKITTQVNNGSTSKILTMGDQGGNLDIIGRPISLANSITATLQQKTTAATANTIANYSGGMYDCLIRKGDNSRKQQISVTVNNNKLTQDIKFYAAATAGDGSTCSGTLLFEAKIISDLTVGMNITPSSVYRPTSYIRWRVYTDKGGYQLGIKTTKVEIKVTNNAVLTKFNNGTDIYSNPVTTIYYGYGQTNWKLNDWKDISSIPDAIKNFNIGTEMPNIYKFKVEDRFFRGFLTKRITSLHLGDYFGTFDINDRPNSFDTHAAANTWLSGN